MQQRSAEVHAGELFAAQEGALLGFGSGWVSSDRVKVVLVWTRTRFGAALRVKARLNVDLRKAQRPVATSHVRSLRMQAFLSSPCLHACMHACM